MVNFHNLLVGAELSEAFVQCSNQQGLSHRIEYFHISSTLQGIFPIVVFLGLMVMSLHMYKLRRGNLWEATKYSHGRETASSFCSCRILYMMCSRITGELEPRTCGCGP